MAEFYQKSREALKDPRAPRVYLQTSLVEVRPPLPLLLPPRLRPMPMAAAAATSCSFC